MYFSFNDKIELLYGLDYCINREKNNLMIYNTVEKNEYIDEFYQIYLDNISNDVKDKIIEMGQFQKKLEYVLNDGDLSFIDMSIFDDWLKKIKSVQEQIILDIKSNKYLENIDLQLIKKFYGMDLGDVEINLSMFISGGFGVYASKTYCALGVKYNSKLSKYTVTGTLVCKIYHEVSHPYIKHKLIDKKVNIINDGDVLDCYKYDYTEEFLVRLVEIIFSSKVFGKEYIEWALNEQCKAGFNSIKNYIDLYYENEKDILCFDDLIKFINNN